VAEAQTAADTALDQALLVKGNLVRLDGVDEALQGQVDTLAAGLATKQGLLTAGQVAGGNPMLQGTTVRALQAEAPLKIAPDTQFLQIRLDQAELAATPAIAALQTAVAGKQDVLGFVPDEDPTSFQILQNGVIRALKVSSPLVATSDMSQVHLSLDPGWSPFFCAGRVNANASVASSIGRVGYSVHRHVDHPRGVYEIRFNTAAPNNDYVVSLTQIGSGNIKLWDSAFYSGLPTAARFYVVMYNASWVLADWSFHFSVYA
jgi:hypothetical protein